MSSIFWGLSMKPNRKYTQTIVKSFHISGAAIEDGEAAKLYVTADKTKFTVATLNNKVPQCVLDLNFCKGDKIMFQTSGDATVSLIGYLHDAEESDDEDFEEEEYASLEQALGKQQKLAAKAKTDSDSEEGSEEEDEDDDEDDDKLAAEYSSFLEGAESGDEEEEDEADSDEEDEDESSEEEEDESPKAKKAKVAEPAKKQNGVAKNEPKKEQPQKQQLSKKEKKAAAAAVEVKKEQPKGANKETKQQQPAGERTITGGVKIQDVNAGNGPEAKQGKRVSVYYIGRLKSNNKTFDSMQKGNGFKFALGGGEVIKGWDVGVVGMKVGGKRRITCPAHMAYGARGHPPTIPPNSTLVFDVELKAVHWN